MPLYFRYNAGNIVDVSTLKQTLTELKKFGVSTSHAIVDAGHCSKPNLKQLYKENIKFLIRIPRNRKIYEKIFNDYYKDALESQNRYIYQERVVGIKRISTKFFNHRIYIYLCVDYNKVKRSKCENKKHFGYFCLLSSNKLEQDYILPLYYTRQTVEQILDISKTNLHILPLRIHNEDTFRGHIMLSFMVILLYLKLNNCFDGQKEFQHQVRLC
jgi:transposase